VTGSRTSTTVVAVALALAIVAGQAGALASAPTGFGPDSGRIARDTGSAYLTGLRRFGAAVLWDRIDPLIHAYYRSEGLDQMMFMVPSLVAVIWLDPHLVSATYVLPWMLAKNGRTKDAVATAAQGVADNPRAGVLRISYAQILFLYAHDTQKAADQVEIALRPDTQWADDLEQWDSLRLGEDILKAAGRTSEAQGVAALLVQISARNGGDAALKNSNPENGEQPVPTPNP
jgi:hypothetical protein